MNHVFFSILNNKKSIEIDLDPNKQPFRINKTDLKLFKECLHYTNSLEELLLSNGSIKIKKFKELVSILKSYDYLKKLTFINTETSED